MTRLCEWTMKNIWRKLMGRSAAVADDTQPFERDRYPPDDLLAQLARQQPVQVANGRELTFQAEPDEFLALLPDAGGSCSREAFQLLRDVLGQLREMDNLVQESCEKEFARSSLARKNFALHLGYIEFAGANAVLIYYGTRVNTSWSAEFARAANGTWQPLNF